MGLGEKALQLQAAIIRVLVTSKAGRMCLSSDGVSLENNRGLRAFCMGTVSPGLRAGCNCFDKKKPHHFSGFLGKQILLPDSYLPVPLSVLAPFKDVLTLYAYSETLKCHVWMSVLCLKYFCNGTRRDGSMFKNSSWSYRGPKFSF